MVGTGIERAGKESQGARRAPDQSNGVVRIGRKGLKKFVFGDDGEPFEVDVVVAFQQWVTIDDSFRPALPDAEGNRPIAISNVPEFHQAAVEFAVGIANYTDGNNYITVAEALDFIARLREQYDEMADFFRPRSRQERESRDTSAAQSALQFSVDPGASSPPSTN